jgi:hypothetical protein
VIRGGQGSVDVASRLTAPAHAVWERVSSFEGINDELMPLMRMTAPRGMRSLQPEDVAKPRRPLPVGVAERAVSLIFRHRHERLRRHFGSATPAR